MFEILKETQLDFMSRRNAALTMSAVLVLASIGVLLVNGLNMGIEFTGGTEMQVKYADAPDIGAIRTRLAGAGLGTPIVTTIGDPADHEVYIRLAARGEADESEDPTVLVLAVLRGVEANSPATQHDLNIEDAAALSAMLADSPDLSASGAERLAEAVLAARREGAIFRSFGDLSAIEGMTPEVVSYLEANASIGPLALRSQSFIGPAVGTELVEKALIAIVGSLIGMLIYIWVRFKFQWGLAAVLALAHDTVITLGLFSIFGQEMSLPVVAAFLTLIGYSVNDTVVVFDRIRENLGAFRGKSLTETINLSINQTLSRTIITSGLTWLVVVGIFLFGGVALRPFSFVLTVGVLVGTYSSIYVASPVVVIWQGWIERRRGTGAGGQAPVARKTKKVDRSQAG